MVFFGALRAQHGTLEGCPPSAQLHPTVEQRDARIGFGAVELGLQTMHKLARHPGVA